MNKKPKNICFFCFLFFVSKRDGEVWWQKQFERGEFFVIYGACIEVFLKKKKLWWIIHDTSFELVYRSPMP